MMQLCYWMRKVYTQQEIRDVIAADDTVAKYTQLAHWHVIDPDSDSESDHDSDSE